MPTLHSNSKNKSIFFNESSCTSHSPAVKFLPCYQSHYSITHWPKINSTFCIDLRNLQNYIFFLVMLIWHTSPHLCFFFLFSFFGKLLLFILTSSINIQRYRESLLITWLSKPLNHIFWQGSKVITLLSNAFRNNMELGAEDWICTHLLIFS